MEVVGKRAQPGGIIYRSSSASSRDMIQAVGTTGVYQGRSGSDGRFTIRNLPNGSYTVLIDRDNYLRGVMTGVTVPNREAVNTEVEPLSVDF